MRSFILILPLFLAVAFNVRAQSPVLNATMQNTNINFSWPTNGDFGLEYSADLVNWRTNYNLHLTNGLYTAAEAVTNSARFYRLLSPCFVTDAPPVISIFRSRKTVVHDPITNYDDAAANTINNGLGGTNIFDASESYDPASCSADTLTFHWVIRFSNPMINPYTVAGVTGYRTSKLTMIPNSLIQSPNDPVSFALAVTSQKTGLSTTVFVNCYVAISSLTATVFYQCQQCLDGTCPNGVSCAISAARPAPPGTE